MPESTTSLPELLDSLPELKPFPDVAMRLLDAANDPGTSARDMAAIIQCDPSIAVQLLRMANSSMFGFSGEIRTVDHAIVVLGSRQVRNLAVTVAAERTFADGGSVPHARADLWQHSLGCAVVARLLASHTSEIAPDEAFMAGVLHDVGKLVFFDHVGEEYLRVTTGVAWHEILDVEQRTFCLDHAEVGERCAEQWGLPYEINDVIARHHVIEGVEAENPYVRLIAAANALSQKWEIGPHLWDASSTEEIVEQYAVKLDVDTLESLRGSAEADFQAVQEICCS